MAVNAGSWTWLQHGVHFGTPFSNFVGWFVVTVIVTGIYRTLDYFIVEQYAIQDGSVILIPVLGMGYCA
jgi:uncharacterized membrane protein